MLDFVGPFCFGLVIGWVTYRTLRRKSDAVALGDIASVIGALGGATVVGVFKADAFNCYCLGLAVGFFAYLIASLVVALNNKGAEATKTSAVGDWMGDHNT